MAMEAWRAENRNGFPPVLQAASLKPPAAVPRPARPSGFSACFAGGLIEAASGWGPPRAEAEFSACFAGGLIEAASRPAPPTGPGPFSACFAGGLIEARSSSRISSAVSPVFRLFCRRPH